MAASAVLVETTILVDYLRRSTPAADYLDSARAQAGLLCSVVTRAELIVGSRTRAELRAIDQLLARFEMEPIETEDSVRALTWLRKYFHAQGVGFHDCLLGAAAVRLSRSSSGGRPCAGVGVETSHEIKIMEEASVT